MSGGQIVVVGGGAAGFFAAITCAEAARDAQVLLLEKGPHFLSKVRISGGGRCNVTHACFDPRQLSTYYPRGGQELLGPFNVFQPTDTIAWFGARGVKLKREPDGRMFPVTDSSQTVINCLQGAASAAGVELLANRGVERISHKQGRFTLELAGGRTLAGDRLMLATGGCRGAAAGGLAVSLGHALEPPVPSLFSFHVATPWLRELAGISIEQAEISVPDSKLREQGPLLLTHQGVSGPVILRLSSWGARLLHARNYHFPLRINWVPQFSEAELMTKLEDLRDAQPARFVVNMPMAPVPSRLWERLVLASGVPRETRWANLSSATQHRLVRQLTHTELPVSGKSLNQDEFVTCGGVRLREVNFKSMESRLCEGLYFGGELLDIDGLTGGFNFQAAWTTGWIAGRAMASSLGREPHN